MTFSSIPAEAVPSSIGKLVSVQIFTLEPEDKTLVKPETLAQHVGILQAFWYTKKDFMFRIQGLPLISVSRQFKSVEIYIH